MAWSGVLLGALLLPGCTVGGPVVGAGGDASPEVRSSASAAPSPVVSPERPEPSTTPDAGADAEVVVERLGSVAEAPQGWQGWQVGGLVFAAPPGLEPSDDLRIGGSTVTLVPAPNADGETLGALAVFVETAAQGPLQLRTDLTVDVRNDQLGSEPVEPPALVDVPGSLGAATVHYVYEQEVAPTGRTVDSVMVEVMIQMPWPAEPAYSVSLSGATELITREDLDSVVASMRMVDETGA